MPDLTLAEMALVVIQRKPGALPKSISVEYDSTGQTLLVIDRFDEEGIRDGDMVVAGDLAHSILRDAMVMATNATRGEFGWFVLIEKRSVNPDTGEDVAFYRSVERLDRDHGGCPTRSLFAAFLAVFPEPAP